MITRPERYAICPEDIQAQTCGNPDGHDILWAWFRSYGNKELPSQQDPVVQVCIPRDNCRFTVRLIIMHFGPEKDCPTQNGSKTSSEGTESEPNNKESPSQT